MLVVSCFYEPSIFLLNFNYFNYEERSATNRTNSSFRPDRNYHEPTTPVPCHHSTPAGCKRNFPDLFKKAQIAFAIVWVPSSSFVSLFLFISSLSPTNYYLGSKLLIMTDASAKRTLPRTTSPTIVMWGFGHRQEGLIGVLEDPLGAGEHLPPCNVPVTLTHTNPDKDKSSPETKNRSSIPRRSWQVNPGTHTMTRNSTPPWPCEREGVMTRREPLSGVYNNGY